MEKTECKTKGKQQVVGLGRPSYGGRRKVALAMLEGCQQRFSTMAAAGGFVCAGRAVAETLLPPNPTFKRTCLWQAA